MYKIGISTCGKKICRELFENYKNAGIEAMEIAVAPEEYSILDYKEISRLSKEYKVELWSLHLSFGPFSKIDISNISTLKHTLEHWGEIIKRASDVGIDKFIVHPSGEPIEETDRSKRMECAKEGLAQLAEIAAKFGGVIAVEDLPRTCLGKNSAEIKELISVDDRLKVCFDTNHLLSENNVDFIHNLKDKIITLHVSDYDFVNERHWLPGEGKVDWNELLKALKEINYKGVWLYEMRFECPKTILRGRPLTCEDFARNAKELFENKLLTIFSQPKPNLGMWE